MPIFEFKCTKCNDIFEDFVNINHKSPKKCKNCDGKLVRLLSKSSFILKGNGWTPKYY